MSRKNLQKAFATFLTQSKESPTEMDLHRWGVSLHDFLAGNAAAVVPAQKVTKKVRHERGSNLDDVLAGVAGEEVAIGVGGAVAAVVDALGLALIGGAVGLGAHPHDVVRREARPVPLQLPCYRHKFLRACISTVTCMHYHDYVIASFTAHRQL